MPRDDSALLYVDVRQHHAVARDQFAIQDIRQLLFRDVRPAMMRYASLLHLFGSISKRSDPYKSSPTLTQTTAASKSAAALKGDRQQTTLAQLTGVGVPTSVGSFVTKSPTGVGTLNSLFRATP